MSKPSELTFARRSILAAAIALSVAAIAFPALSLANGFAPYTKGSFDKALKGTKPVLVHVHAEWCPVCKKQETVFNEISKGAEFGKLSAFVVDFDKETDFRKTYGVNNQSVVLVFKGGKEVARSNGDTDKTRLAALVEAAVK